MHEELKKQVYEKARELGANLIGCAPVERWEEFPIQEQAFWPQKIWPWATHVLVLGIPLFAPMMAATPSMVYQELYDTSNRVLDDLAYKVANYLTQLGHRAIYFPRDCYSNIEVLLKNPSAAFSHVIAGYYAGLGTIGESHNLITPQFGPRLRIVSVITDAPIPADPMSGRDVCIHCKKCMRSCPSQCFTDVGEEVLKMDKIACTQYHVDLVGAHHWPCGVCALVCPVGEDLKNYRKTEMITEAGRTHCQSYGS